MAFFRSVATVGFFTLLSRLLGFIRDLVTAILMGAGPVADAFVLASRLPNAFRMFFAEGAVDAAFIPLYTRKLRTEGEAAARRFSSQIFTLMLLILIPFTLLGLLFIHHIVAFFAPGFEMGTPRFELAVTYSLITFGYLLLVSVSALQGGMLNARGKFAPFAAAPVIMNTTLIIGLSTAAVLKLDVGLYGSWALMAGGVIQLVVLWFFCRRGGMTLSFLWPPKWNADVKKFFKLVGPGVIGTDAAHISTMFSTLFTSHLPAGTVAALYYADRLDQIPFGVIGLAISAALLPLLSRHVAAKEEKQAVYYFSRSTEVALVLSMPFFLAFLVEAEPIVRILFQYGAFTAEDTKITAEALMAYAPVVPGFVFIRILVVSFFACEDAKRPVVVGLSAVAINFAASALLMPLWKHVGIALALSLSVWVNVIWLTLVLFKHHFFKFDKEAVKRLPRLVLSTVLTGLSLYVTHAMIAGKMTYIPSPVVQEMVELSIRLISASIVYVAAVHFTGAMPLHDVSKFLKRKPA